ncbi:MAG: PBSX family phage terminase large subunit [Oscillospiraceae bacterium]|jgi:phage terminase large subunit|nr:PBSX family phage terminase large subunit [Oscillospiraceae bacterium]
MDVRLSETVGGGYAEFWNCRKRYRVVKGSRASKKSKTTALWFVFNIMKYPQANALIVRKTFRTLRTSCFADMQWAINRLGVSAKWKCLDARLEMTYKPTGQKVYFRGLDDPMKIASIAVERGCLCWMWVEEAYEIMNETDFMTLDESIRGAVPPGLFKQTTITFNPWNDKHWLKARFFDNPDDATFTATTNYKCNEWLDEEDARMFERMRDLQPRRYQVAGLGNWGAVDGVIYEHFCEKLFDIDSLRKKAGIQSAFGLDFGYTIDPSALFCGLVDVGERVIYVFDEIYQKGMSNEAIYQAISKAGYAKERIVADSAEPKSIDRLRTLGMRNIVGSRKGADSVVHGISYINEFHMIIHPRCVNFLTEINNYTWATDKSGKTTGKPGGMFNHLMDAMRYAMESIEKPGGVTYLS